MKVIIRKNYDECAEYVAKHIEEKISKVKPKKEDPFVLGLPTGSTPIGVYQKLIDRVKAKALSFRNVVTFNMDEYVGLNETDEQSYHYFMHHNFFDHIDIESKNIHILDGMAKDLEKECKEYEKKIAKYKKINLFFGSIGSDGHIAFNEPCSSLSSRTRVKNLAIETIEANSRFFEGDYTKVPKRALTVGIGTIMDAEEVLIMATGHVKARAVKHAVEGSINHLWTVSALQLHRNAILVCDEDAIEEVKVKTYRYFKEIHDSL